MALHMQQECHSKLQSLILAWPRSPSRVKRWRVLAGRALPVHSRCSAPAGQGGGH